MPIPKRTPRSFLWDKWNGRKEKWILASCWDHFRWPGNKLPSKKTLDKYFPDIPVFLPNKEYHGAWGNSKLFEMFNITKDTPDPKGGRFERDNDGEPAGYIHEAAMFTIIKKIVNDFDEEDVSALIKAFTQKANSCGITSVGDVSMFGITLEEAYKKLEEKDELTVRIHYSMDIESDIEKILKAQKTYSGPMVKFNGVKGFIDGTPMGHSGYMLEPYADIPDFRSEPLFEPDTLYKIVDALDKAGIRIRIHACGDGGVRLCLDAYEHAIKANGKNDLRHCIEHIECTTPVDIARFGELGVIPSIQPDHMPKYHFGEHPFHRMIGEERMKYCWPFNSLLRSADVLAYGTDFPVAPLLPTRGIWRAVTRTTDDGKPKGGWNPQERLSVHEILQACTCGPAYAAGRENEIGTLEAGKLADLAVFDENIFEMLNDREKMFSMQARMTIVDGRIVYRR